MYRINSIVYLNKRDETYERLITISPKPSSTDPIKTKQIKHNQLSEFDTFSPSRCSYDIQSCFNAVINPDTNQPFCLDQLTEFISYITSNGYIMDYKLSKLISTNKNIPNRDFLFYIRK